MNGQNSGRPDLPLLDLHFLGCGTDWRQAAVILFGAPYDGTASFRPGSRFGPAAMRLDSAGLETYSPYLDRDLSASRICDLGDLELPPGDRAATLARIGSTAAAICAGGKKPVILGGEHLVTLPAVQACLEKWPELCLIHLDAHADLRQDYLGESLSHATVMRRIWDQLGDGRIWQLGHPLRQRRRIRLCPRRPHPVFSFRTPVDPYGHPGNRRAAGLAERRSRCSRSVGISGNRHARTRRARSSRTCCEPFTPCRLSG